MFMAMQDTYFELLMVMPMWSFYIGSNLTVCLAMASLHAGPRVHVSMSTVRVEILLFPT